MSSISSQDLANTVIDLPDFFCQCDSCIPPALSQGVSSGISISQSQSWRWEGLIFFPLGQSPKVSGLCIHSQCSKSEVAGEECSLKELPCALSRGCPGAVCGHLPATLSSASCQGPWWLAAGILSWVVLWITVLRGACESICRICSYLLRSTHCLLWACAPFLCSQLCPNYSLMLIPFIFWGLRGMPLNWAIETKSTRLGNLEGHFTLTFLVGENLCQEDGSWPLRDRVTQIKWNFWLLSVCLLSEVLLFRCWDLQASNSVKLVHVQLLKLVFLGGGGIWGLEPPIHLADISSLCSFLHWARDYFYLHLFNLALDLPHDGFTCVSWGYLSSQIFLRFWTVSPTRAEI